MGLNNSNNVFFRCLMSNLSFITVFIKKYCRKFYFRFPVSNFRFRLKLVNSGHVQIRMISVTIHGESSGREYCKFIDMILHMHKLKYQALFCEKILSFILHPLPNLMCIIFVCKVVQCNVVFSVTVFTILCEENH